MNLIDTLTRLDGRIGRKNFWLGFLVLVALFVLAIVTTIVIAGEDALDGPYSGSSLATLFIGILSLIASIPLMLKRLHDLNRSYGLLVPVFAIEALVIAGDLTGLTGTETEPNALGWVLAAIYGIYSLALFIHLGFYRGTAGPNDFGPDPLEASPTPALP